MFENIAIIGSGCVLPGALNPEQLWQNVLTKRDCLSDASKQRWRVDPQQLLNKVNDHEPLASIRGGFINGFASIFDATGFAINVENVLQQDISWQWLLHASQQALDAAGYSSNSLAKIKAGLIVGSLLYPNEALSAYAEAHWLLKQTHLTLNPTLKQTLLNQLKQPEKRFASGYPLQLLARALNIKGDAFAIDAACASSLYAIKLGCDYLHDRTADIMLVGGLNGADSLFLNMGFTALTALSKNNTSRPLHKQADGLIPAQGAGMVVLKRLEDAIAAQDNILGVIRGVGLANDGRSEGFLVPALTGQLEAMQRAYQQSGVEPKDISWIECHATGTPIGDSTEIRSMQTFFNSAGPIAIGTLKAVIGHSITASGMAALINVLSAFKHELKPPSRLAAQDAIPLLAESQFCLLDQTEAWQYQRKKTRLAAINAFGFGGNNAHLIVEAWHPRQSQNKPKAKTLPANKMDDIAIVGLGIIAASATNKKEFAEALFAEKSLLKEFLPATYGGYLETIELSIKESGAMPADLKQSLSQQLALLKAGQEALSSLDKTALGNAAVFVGMQSDAEIARFGLRWRLAELLTENNEQWLAQARHAICNPLTAAGVIGTLPNMVTNRLNSLYNLTAGSFSLAADELSGITALELGMRALRAHEIDTAVVGAVDLNCESVHHSAICALQKNIDHISGDAAVVLVLKRKKDAQQQGHKIYSIVTHATADAASVLKINTDTLNPLFGQAQAAIGLVQTAAAALICAAKQQSAAVQVNSMTSTGISKSIYIEALS